MRRLAATIVFGLSLLACARTPQGPSAPIAREQVGAGQGLDAAVARRSVEAFVRAYAQASADGGTSLASTVVGPKLDAWVQWLNVQNTQFDGPVTGVKVGAADWRVLDATRDGVPMSDGIQLFKKEEQTDGGLTVRMDSLFMFAPSWQFNLVVTNGTDHAVQLEPSGVALLRRSGGGFERIDGALTGSLAVIPARSTVEGLMAYQAQDAADRRTLAIAYRDGRTVLRFEFPLHGLVKVAPPPAPTTTGLVATGAS